MNAIEKVAKTSFKTQLEYYSVTGVKHKYTINAATDFSFSVRLNRFIWLFWGIIPNFLKLLSVNQLKQDPCNSFCPQSRQDVPEKIVSGVVSRSAAFGHYVLEALV